jgi:hypothetical protein
MKKTKTKTKQKNPKTPNTQENGKSQEAKIGLQKPDSCLFKFR